MHRDRMGAQGNQALVDDVRDALIEIAGEESDRRIKDIAVQLKKVLH
ncbi:hypothetical protein [Vibrio harveyi]